MAHILIIDDDPTVLKLIAAILARAGHTITTDSSGSAALKTLGAISSDSEPEPPALIILDIMMPKMDGYLIGRAIRDAPRTRDIPLIIVSALQEMSRLFTATVEVQGFIRKPFSPEELIAEVGRVLKSSQSTDSEIG
jgi:CheY-like chemotaxis protein